MTFSSPFGERLKEARKVVGWSQAEAAEVAGVTREYWGRCERGASIPGGEALSALAQRGYDVLYVLTGEREGQRPMALSSEERLLVDYYRDASPAVRKAAMAVLLSGAPSGGGMHMSNLGDGNVQIGGGVGGSVRIKKGK